MVLTNSTMLPLGTPLPLEAIERHRGEGVGAPYDPSALAGRPVLVVFLCPHCPFVKHVEPELGRLQADLAGQVALLGICSNSPRTHPQDGLEGMRVQAEARGWTFPYLLDPDQAIARAFRAACTPDPFLFDAAHRLVYRGQLDDSRPGNALSLDGRDLRAAVAAVLAGEPVPVAQKPSIGCNIKWHPGQEPPWFG
ncbi:MAG: thioredoxin family protein [Synechococcaceae cyanobacterium ELA739]